MPKVCLSVQMTYRIPGICKKTAVIVTPMRQEFVYHELENRVSVFSHVRENFTVNCGDVTLQHCLGKGLNSVLLPVGCEAATSELRIMAPSVGADDTTLKPLIHELDMIDEIGELGKDLVALHGINASMLSDELSEYMKALKVEELDIDKVSVTLENMRHLSDIKEYSVTKLSLKEIGSVFSTVTITAWTVEVLILLLVTVTCCKCCSPCAAIGTAIWDLVKCFFGGLWSLGKWLIGRRSSEPKVAKETKRKLVGAPSMRKKFRREGSKINLNKSASASKASMNTVSVGLDDIERVLDWSVRYEKDKLMISAVLDGLELYFNPYSGKVEDAAGKRHLLSVPDVNILTIAEDLRRSIKPPELIDIGGMKRVKSEQSVYVDPTDRKFRKSTGDLAPAMLILFNVGLLFQIALLIV